MGRHLKRGLDYFNVDCVQEDNLNYLEAKHGISGYGVLVKLWRKIYMVEGYFCEWSEKNIVLFGKEISVPVDEIKAIVETCFSEGIFQEEMYKNYGVLTSSGVQKRWLRIVSDAKRKECVIDPKLLITLKTPSEKAFTPEEIIKNPEESTQRKVKESRVKESNEEKSMGAPVAPQVTREKKKRETFVAPTFQEIRDRFTDLRGQTESPGCWPADRIHNEAQKMLAHYTANGWVQGKGKPIVDWKAACVTWITNAIEGTFAPVQHRPAAPAAIRPMSVEERPKIERELNYLYDKFRDGECTEISIDSVQYNYLKKAGRISFHPDRTAAIRDRAVNILGEKKPAATEGQVVEMMKRVGVIEFFKDLQTAGAEAVFQ